MKVALLTREYPPEIYGGAGVHVEYLSQALASLVEVKVHCFGSPRPSPLVARAYGPWDELRSSGPAGALQAMAVDLRMADQVEGSDLVHSHTWYANFGGHLAKLLLGVPHVMTAHSLEPLRPWKAEQLGGGYAVSSFCERVAIEAADAVIAVSSAMAADILGCYPAVEPKSVHVIHNGIDLVDYAQDDGTDVLERLGVDPGRPIVLWVGRVSRQKGIAHLLDMGALIAPEAQLVLLAGQPDTPSLGAEMSERAAALARSRAGVHWVEDMLPRRDVVQLLSHASVFVCPSVYEPFGLINLEAMACRRPVVATAVGGIPEVVVDGETGYLVPLEQESGLGARLAERVDTLLADPALGRAMGEAGRARVEARFTWHAVAAQVVELYSSLL